MEVCSATVFVGASGRVVRVLVCVVVGGSSAESTEVGSSWHSLARPGKWMQANGEL